MTTTPNHTLRAAAVADAPEIARLLTVLGHPTDTAQVATMWPAWAAEGNVALVAARPDGTLCGLMTLRRSWVFHRKRAIGRITSLVVDEDVRSNGIGAALVERGEQILRDLGCGLVEVTSNGKRVRAHAFYERLGYDKTSVRLVKTLNDS